MSHTSIHFPVAEPQTLCTILRTSHHGRSDGIDASTIVCEMRTPLAALLVLCKRYDVCQTVIFDLATWSAITGMSSSWVPPTHQVLHITLRIAHCAKGQTCSIEQMRSSFAVRTENAPLAARKISPWPPRHTRPHQINDL